MTKLLEEKFSTSVERKEREIDFSVQGIKIN
jgi:hypothetical protein